MRKSPFVIDTSHPLFSFGLFADCQYADKLPVSTRQYRLSLHKLEEIINFFNQRAVKFVVNLGDLIDSDINNYTTVKAILTLSRVKIYHLLGNHDYNVQDSVKYQVAPMLSLSETYSYFIVENWRFVLLDGNQISFYAHSRSSPLYQQAVAYYKKNKIHSPDWNGAVDSLQLEWLKTQLTQATDANQNVIILNHFPIFPKNIHNLWNAHDVLQIVEQFPCVKVYIAGHNHGGEFQITRKSQIPFLTLKGVVDTHENAYSVCHVFPNYLVLEGFGRETFKGYKSTKTLLFKNSK